MKELSKMELYRLRKTAEMPNIKDIIGETMTPCAWHEHEYTDADGEVHNVLAIAFDNGKYYRTEVAAFIENFRDYVAVFGDDENRPAIQISGKRSKRGNPFVNFVVVGE